MGASAQQRPHRTRRGGSCTTRVGSTISEPGGSACRYWDRYGTQSNHPAQGQHAPGIRPACPWSAWSLPAFFGRPSCDTQIPRNSKSGYTSSYKALRLNVDVGSRGKRTAPVGRQSIPSAPPCPRAGWVSISRFEWLRDAVQPSGLRTHGGRRDRAGQRVGDSPCGVYREPASPAEPR